ncbi:MAG: tetratricopeptide repeat protein [Planctomycetes bacterium]|nr:tetratricopeptide repeat protein [Planctomycetota bacterium]
MEPSTPSDHYYEGLELRDQKRYQEALYHFKCAHAGGYESPELDIELARILSHLSRPEEALCHLKEAIARLGGNAELYQLRGTIYLSMMRYSNALYSFNVALEFQPGSTALLIEKAWTLYNMERYPEALTALDQAGGSYGEESHDQRLRFYVLRAKVYMKLDMIEPCAYMLEAALKLDPANVPALEAAAELAFFEGRPQNCISFLERAHKIKSDWTGGYVLLGKAQLLTGEFMKALKAFTSAELYARDAPMELSTIMLLKGKALHELGRDEHALSAYGEAISLDETLIDAYVLRAKIYLGSARYPEAIDELAMALNYSQMTREIRQLRKDAELQYAIALADEGDFAGTISLLRRILRRDPDIFDFPECLRRGTDDSTILEKYRDGFLRASKLMPRDADTHLLLGFLFLELSDLARAREHLKKSLGFEKENAAFGWYGLGRYHQQKRDYKKAVKYFDRAIASFPNFIHPWYSKAMLLEYRGEDPATLRHCLRHILSLNPDLLDVRSSLARVYEQLGEYHWALDSALMLLEKSPSDPELLFQVSRLLYKLDRIFAAREKIEEAISISPEFRYVTFYCEILVRSGDSAAADQKTEETIASYHAKCPVQCLLELFLLRAELFIFKKRDLQRAQDVLFRFDMHYSIDAPHLQQRAIYLGACLSYRDGDFVECARLVDEALSLDTDEVRTDVLLLKSRCLRQNKDLAGALLAADAILAKDPRNIDALEEKYKTLCQFKIPQPRIDEAITVHEMLDMEKDIKMCLRFLDQDDFEDAWHLAKELLAKYPQEPRMYLLQAASATMIGRQSESIDALKKLYEVDRKLCATLDANWFFRQLFDHPSFIEIVKKAKG